MKTTFLLLPLLFVGCISKQRCNELFPPSVHTEHTTTIIKRDSVIPGATIVETFNIHDTVFMNTIRERVIVRQDTSGRAELRYWIDENGRLRMECEAKDKMIEWVEKHSNTTTVEKRTAANNWQEIVFVAVSVIAVIILGVMVFKALGWMSNFPR
jgi:hypothetical protein